MVLLLYILEGVWFCFPPFLGVSLFALLTILYFLQYVLFTYTILFMYTTLFISMTLFTYTLQLCGLINDVALIDDMVVSYWINNMALTDYVVLTHNVIECYWTKIRMSYGLMMWQHLIGLKCWYNIDWWWFQRIKTCHVMQSLVSGLFSSDGHDLSIVAINRRLPPNLTPLNLLLNSIFCNSLFILYFLCILINYHFTPYSIIKC